MNKNMMTIACLLLAAGFAFAQSHPADLIFSHKLHTETVGATCTDCHAAVDTSLHPADNLLPDMETCYTCHDREAACTMCHKDPDNAAAYPRITGYIAHFPHQLHIAQKVDCQQCHAGIALSEDSQGGHLPGMAVCSSCHTDRDKPDYCYDCHGRDQNLRPADHRLDWRKAHAVAKYADENSCKICHTDNYCLECHKQGNLDHKVHPLNYIHNHGLYAKGDKEQCYTCHEDRAFCIDCHRAEMVYPKSHNSAGWANKINGGAHRRAAAGNLDECLSCHSDDRGDPICAQCHH